MMGPLLDAYMISWVVFLPFAAGVILLLANAFTSFLLRANGLPTIVWQVVAMANSGYSVTPQ